MRKEFLAVILSVFLLPLFSSADDRPSPDPAGIKKAVFELTNAEREKRGLPRFIMNMELADLALIHSRNMATHNFFSHTDHENLTPSGRKQKYHPGLLGGIGENIAYGYGYTESTVADKLIQMWMNSPGHRANILRKNYSHMGVGIYRNGNRYYATQVFGTLVARLSDKLPATVPFGSELKIRFSFLGMFPKEKLTVFVHFPDRNARFYTKSGSFYTGVGPHEPEWDGENFSITIKFNKGRGPYRITMGSRGRFYPEGISIRAQ